MARDDKTLADKLSEDDDEEPSEAVAAALAKAPKKAAKGPVSYDPEAAFADVGTPKSEKFRAQPAPDGLKYDPKAVEKPAPLDVKPGEFRPTPTAKDTAGPDANATYKQLEDTADGPAARAFAKGLMSVESRGGDVEARPVKANGELASSAKGKYQFTDGWDKQMKEWTGYTTGESMPPPNATPEQKAAAEKIQDAQWSAYYKNFLIPTVKQLKDSGDAGEYNDQELAYLVHHNGAAGARSFLAQGEDKYANTEGNAPIRGLMRKVSLASQSAPTGASDLGRSRNSQLGIASSKTRTPYGVSDKDADAYLAEANPQAAQDAADMKKVMYEKGGEGDEFATELKKLRADYAEEKDLNAKRELADTLAEALTKFGAGRMGAKTGVDMSHIKFEPHDFQKDRQLAATDYQTGLADLKGRREEDQKKREAAADASFKLNDAQLKRAEFGYQVDKGNQQGALASDKAVHENAYQDAMVKYHLAMIDASKETSAQNREEKIQAAQAHLKQTAGDQVARILSSKEVGKEGSQAGAIAAALAPFNVPDKVVHKIVYEPGMIWGENVSDPQDIALKAQEAISKYGSMPGTHPVHARGKTYYFSTQTDADNFRRTAGVTGT